MKSGRPYMVWKHGRSKYTVKSTPLISPDRNRVSTNQNRTSPTTTEPIHTTRGEGAQPSKACHSEALHRHGRRRTTASRSAGTRTEDRWEAENRGPADQGRPNQNCFRYEAKYNEERPPRLVHTIH